MRSIQVLSSIMCLLTAVSAGCCAAQAASPKAEKSATRILPPVAEIRSPFAIDAPPSQRANAIEFLAENAMTAEDRQAVGAAMPVIRKKAQLRGFDLAMGKWYQQQIACPVLPDYILLLFTRDRGVGDRTKFSAVLPRANGAVRILPILRRSYSLFPPARENQLTITAFNLLREREHPGRKVDWLATGLCYAALTGAQVKLPPVENGPSQTNVSPAMSSLLQIEEDGTAVVRFFDVEEARKPEEWGLTFAKDGKLMSVAVTPWSGLKPKQIP